MPVVHCGFLILVGTTVPYLRVPARLYSSKHSVFVDEVPAAIATVTEIGAMMPTARPTTSDFIMGVNLSMSSARQSDHSIGPSVIAVLRPTLMALPRS